MNRRDFFRSLGVAAGAAVVPISAKPKTDIEAYLSKNRTFSFGWSGYKNADISNFYASNIIQPTIGRTLYVKRPLPFNGGKELRSPLTYGV